MIGEAIRENPAFLALRKIEVRKEWMSLVLYLNAKEPHHFESLKNTQGEPEIF